MMPAPLPPRALAGASIQAAAGMRQQRFIPAWLLSFLMPLTALAVLGLALDVTSRQVAQGERTGGSDFGIRVHPVVFGPGDEAPGQARSESGGKRSPGVVGSGQTEVFGVTGKGNRFVYVFDRSKSMSNFEGRPLASAKRELIASLAKLDKVHQFQIIFYNHEPRIMSLAGGQSRMVFADDDGKKLAGDFADQVVADGGTRHMEALKMALRLRPDVIFFLTDADEPGLSRDELAKIRKMNEGAKINTIEFGAGASSGKSNFLQQLARENGGNYGYVDVTRLPKE